MAVTTVGGSGKAPTAPNLTGTGAAPASKTSIDFFTGGWAIVIGFGIGILLGNTQIGPLVAGVLGIGLIYQLVNLVEGK